MKPPHIQIVVTSGPVRAVLDGPEDELNKRSVCFTNPGGGSTLSALQVPVTDLPHMEIVARSMKGIVWGVVFGIRPAQPASLDDDDLEGNTL